MHAPALQTASKTDRVSSNRLCSDGDEVSFACWTRAQDVGSTTPCTCTCSRTPLRAVTASRLDAHSTGAAPVYSSRCLPSSVYSSHRKGRQNNREKGKIEGARCTGSGLMSMRPLPAAATTRGDASRMSAASVYSCSTSQIRVRLAWLAFPQDRASARVVVPSACSTTRGACRSMRPLPAAATTRGDASSMSAASV